MLQSFQGDRHDRGTPEHSYKFVRKQLKAYLDRNCKRANRSALKKALGGKGAKVPAAPGTKGKGKGKGKGKEKGGGKGNSGKGGKSGKGKGAKVCFEWRDSGACSKGSDCPYADSHNAGNKKTPGKGKGKGKDKGSKPCSYYAQGSCKLGDSCPYSHADGNVAPAAAGDKPKKKKRWGNKKKAPATPAVFAPLVASTLIAVANGSSIPNQQGATLCIGSNVSSGNLTVTKPAMHIPAMPAPQKSPEIYYPTATSFVKAVSAPAVRRTGGNARKSKGVAQTSAPSALAKTTISRDKKVCCSGSSPLLWAR